MNFAEPAFLFLALLTIPVLVLAARSRAPVAIAQRRWVTAMQVVGLLAAAVALAGPWTMGGGAPVHRVVVWAGEPTPATAAWLAAARDAGRASDPFVVVRAGAKPAFGLPGAVVLPGAEGTPDLAAALRAAALAIPSGAAGQIELCTDGVHDGEALAATSNELVARGIPVHVRELPVAAPAAVRVLRVAHAPRTAIGEAFRIEVHLQSAVAGQARLEVRDGTTLVGGAPIVLRIGAQQHAVDAVLQQSGVRELDCRLVRADADEPRAVGERSAVLVDAGLRVLHVAADASRREALAAALRDRGITTVPVESPATLDAAAFAGVGAVFVDDVPATAWPMAAQAALREQLLTGGTGLVLAGTHQNLGPGGYATSPLQDVLPVRMPQREERRDPSVSLVLIVDTSGSMGGGRLELAKEVARLSIQKLQPHDKVGLIEFHGSKRWAAPLQPATNTIEITRALNRLQVGGGTIIYDALEESYYALLNAQTRFQHVLVLTDGGVESGPFEALARRMGAAGQTVSSVLIGPQANSPFLLNLAQWGRGRFYSCPDKFQLPDLQFREPQSSLLPAVQERAVPLQRVGAAEAVAAFAGDELPPSGGLVEASVRSDAEVLLRGVAGEPYLVGWDQGAGRVLVLAGQALGPQSGKLHDDAAYGAFLADLLRSAAGGALALLPELRIQTQERGARLRLRVPAGAHLPAVPSVRWAGAPAVRMVDDGDGWVAFLPWAGTAGRQIDVVADSVVLAQGAAVPPADRRRRTAPIATELDALAVVTGGSRLDVGSALPAAPEARSPQVVEHAAAFTFVALAAFAAGLLLRRLPWRRSDTVAAPGSARAGLGAVGALWLLAALAPAQQPAPGLDETSVRAAIDTELRERGDLGLLAQRWRDGSPLQRFWLARAQGDLTTAARLAADPALAATYREVRVQMLDLLGRPAEALAALGEPDAALAPAARGAFLLRRAVLQSAAGAQAATAADLQAAVTAAAAPDFTQQTAVVAAALGQLELALQWHRVGAEPGRDACQAALRRGLWQQRAGRPAAAAAEYELAFQRGAMQRDRAFALAMLVAVHRRAGSLAALADGWLARAAGQGPALHLQEFAAMGEVLRELGRARDGLRALERLTPEARRELGDLPLALAVEAGEVEQAIAQLQQQVAAHPEDAVARCALAVLLADLQRDAEAEQTLRGGVSGAKVRDLRRLCAAASELGMDAVVQAIATAVEAGGAGEAGDPIEGALLEVAHLRRQGKDALAVARLVKGRAVAQRPQDRLRFAEQFESLGRQKEAIELYTQIWDEVGTEDTGMRLAWLLGESKVEADRKRAQAIFRKVWTQAGSAARRVQAEEHVLDLAAREGNLADLAIELEGQLADAATPNRPAVRDALVKIYTRARDTMGAIAILQQWAKEEPARQIESLQQQARVHLSAEEFRSHERALQRLLEVDPEGELDYRQQLAMSALERGRPEDARKHIRGLLGKPGVPDTVALEFGAGIYALAAQHEESVRLYRRALALHPERVETFLLLGNALRAAGQRDAAIGTFQELLLRPLPDDLFVVAIDGLLNMEAPGPVVAAAARAVRLRLALRPDQVFLHRVLQDLLESQQDEAGRLLALEDTVVAAGEQRTNFVRELMQEAETRRDWTGYAAHGRTLLLLGDEVPPAVYLSLGEALLHTGEVDAAARAFARARLGPDFATVELRTAELYENAGRLAEAERLRIRLLRRTPEEPGAVLAVARLAERQGALARALPNWLAAAQRLLPAELDAQKPAGRRIGVASVSREKPGITFAEPFAGVLRCATASAQLEPLWQALAAAAAKGKTDRRLTALRLQRQVAQAYADGALAAQVQAAEDALLAEGDEAVRTELRARRLLAGDLTGAYAVPAGAQPTAAELRVLLLGGGPDALAASARKAEPGLLPDLARMLLRAGRAAEAQALLPLVEAATGAEATAARDELRSVLGLAVAKDDAKARQKLEQALARTGPLLAKINAVAAALRELPDLPAGERRAHVQTLASAVVAAKDAAAAERLLANARADLDGELAAQLVELVFTTIDRAFLVQSRAQYLAAVPTERGIELVRTALRKFRDEERRQQLLQILGNPAVPEAVQLGLVGDCDPRGVQGTDRLVFTNGLDRARAAPAVLRALAQRFTEAVPDDPLTWLVQVRAAEPAATQRQLARAAVARLGTRTLGDRDENIVAQLVRLLTSTDAVELLAQLPTKAPVGVRIPLLQKAGDKTGAADAFLAAHRAKPDDAGLLYRAANFFEGEGMFAKAAELYRTAQKNSATFYPYQAQQLAQLELRAGNPLGALAALRAAKDPSQMNFRLVLRVLAEVPDAELRRAVLADALQQRAARGAGTGTTLFSRVFGIGVGLGAAGPAGDRLAAVLAPVRLPQLAPADLQAAEQAPSDYDLLAFLPEGEAVAQTLLRTMDEASREADLGIYRGWLGAARRAGRGQQLIDAASARLAQAPLDAEALRVLFAGAQVGFVLPPEVLERVLQYAASAPQSSAATLGSLIMLAADAGRADFVERLLRSLLQQSGELGDAQLRPWLPGLFAMACRQLPEVALRLAQSGGLASDEEAELGAALLLHHPDATAVAAVVGQAQPATNDRFLSRDGSDLLPRVGGLLMRGEIEVAAAQLALPDTYWLQPRALPAHRLAAAVPPLARWQHPERAMEFGERLLGMLAVAEDERAGVLARVTAVLAARLAAAGQAAAAADLRQRLRAATTAVSWPHADWLGD